MKNYNEVISATMNEKDGRVVYSAILDLPNAVVSDVSVIMKDDGTVVAYPPQDKYTTKDENGNDVVKYRRVVVFKDAKAMNAAAEELVKNPTDKIYLFETPKDIKGGKRLGVAALTGDITLCVTAIVTEDKRSLIIPGREYKTKDGTDAKSFFARPFDSKGEEYQADKEALIDEIIAIAKPYEKKGE
jgi:hypothetical protein